ncbi:hypothetical protein [Variovorax fucosicus]|uniref:hypothetical protein n=1 Tax=Variovorax fucosicus TaxID=3053517 RepID=UPI00257815D1|nr:hypothetical protein [Variovorax sp. J22G47]MDM0056465.1 hypothetical protein [Variovorax sp. J22G47]
MQIASREDTGPRSHAFVTAMATPDVQESMQKQGNVINLTSPDAAAKFFRDEKEKYARVVRAAGVTVT